LVDYAYGLILAERPTMRLPSVETLVDAIAAIVGSSIMLFQDGYLRRQLRCLAMGSSFAHNYASLWLGRIEKPTLRRLNLVYRGRFADDANHLARQSLGEVKEILLDAYSETPALQIDEWSVIVGGTGEMPFLDVVWSLHDTPEGVEVRTRTHQKPINTYAYLAPSSYHPASTLVSWIGSEATRYLRLSSTRDAYEQQLALFTSRLQLRGYDADAVRAQLAKHPYDSREALLVTVEARHGGRDGHDRALARALADADDDVDARDDDALADVDDMYEVDVDDEPRNISSTHIVLRRHPAAERAAPRIRAIVSNTLATIAPSSHGASRDTRVTIAWKLPEPLESILSRVPKTEV